MLSALKIYKYRKLENLTIEFSDGVNVISGTNGTCKTSLLHLVSNSFQVPNKKCPWINDSTCLDALNKMNNMINPKVETLTKGDVQYNDPAPNFEGALYDAIYAKNKVLSFRRHNSKDTIRYSVKPYYKAGKGDSLPFCPVIYLGLTRLYPFGEFMDEEHLKRNKNYLPKDYIDEMDQIYKELTGMEVREPVPQAVGKIKRRSDFSTQLPGIDANTISDGEDNLYIILTALECLKFYTENVKDSEHKNAILLIDEYDATLHPSQQVNLLRIMCEYSVKYHIQVIFTTHSLSTLEEALRRKMKVFYFIDNIRHVDLMEMPDIFKIKMFLYGKTKDDIFDDKKIPLFTEDDEARELLNILLDYYRDIDDCFRPVRSYFYFVNAKLGSDNLRSLFKDDFLFRTMMGAICILDGDQVSDKGHNIITLPGNSSPEDFLINYSLQLFDKGDKFWSLDKVIESGYNATYFRDTIKKDIDNISQTIENLRNNNKTTHSIERVEKKKIFKRYKAFWLMVFKYWMRQREGKQTIKTFFDDLYSMYRKVSQRCGINPNLWARRDKSF